jgi:S-adenosylmethionine-diacylglycerol 3-amino-3-carboxypropyl transferase
MANALLERAAHQAAPASRRGMLERLFTLMFQGFVYNQIWEDPSVDLDALKLEPNHRVVTIASGGCNILNYLAAAPAKIFAVDLNPHHVALTKLKLAALAHLPDHESFFRFFGQASDPANLALFDSHVRDRLDEETRAHWQAMSGAPKRRRIEMFARNLYRHGLLGRFIGLLHGVARLHGKKLEDLLDAKNPREQRELFNQIVAPLFESAPIKLMSKSPISLYALGIPPAQYDALVESGKGDAISVLRERVERLACDFPIRDNYFAWQAFGRSYSDGGSGPLPPYLERAHFDTIRDRADRVEVLNRSFTEYLKSRPAQSLDRYVLLDAQDWMSDLQLNDLWSEITRTARPGARVIFRTAAEPSLLPGRVDEPVLAQWRYETEASRDLTRRDRSAIYGGFHLYVFGG